MLASVSDFFVWWQLPLFLIFLPAFVFGGGALLWVGGRFIAKSPKATFWRSVGTNILASLAASVAAVVAGALVPVAGWAAGLVVYWLIVMAMFKVSFGKAILAWLPTLGQVVVVVPLLVALLMPGLDRARELAKRASCINNLTSISTGVTMYQASKGQFPATLDDLVKEGQSPRVMICPSDLKNRRSSYFYMPPARGAKADDATIIACDFRDNHHGRWRSILYADTHVGHATEEAFQEELAKPVNADFANALKAAESQ